MFPMSLDEKISPNAPVRLVNQIVDNLDISKVFDTYNGGGTSSYHPRMMLKRDSPLSCYFTCFTHCKNYQMLVMFVYNNDKINKII